MSFFKSPQIKWTKLTYQFIINNSKFQSQTSPSFTANKNNTMDQQEPLSQYSPDSIQHKSTTIIGKFIQDQEQRINNEERHIFEKIILGQLFLQGYRTFKSNKADDLIVLFKKVQINTEYCFLKLVKKSTTMSNLQLLSVQNAIQKIEKMLRRKLQSFKVLIQFIDDLKTIKMDRKVFYQAYHETNMYAYLIEILNNQHKKSSNNDIEYPMVIDYRPKNLKQSEQLLIQSEKQFAMLKQLLSVYVDTFGDQNKTYLYKEMEKSSTSFSLQMLLNTLNYIVFQETKGQPYSQIESSYLTYFNIKQKKFELDKKYITFSGSGQILFVDLIFMKQIVAQRQKTQAQIKPIIDDCRKYYKKGKLKVYKITNQEWKGKGTSKKNNIINLDSQSEQEMEQQQQFISTALIYRLETTVLGSFSD